MTCLFLDRSPRLRRSSVTSRVSRPTWWFVMALQMVTHLHFSYCLESFHVISRSYVFLFFVSIVTGLHDVDEYIQAQLLLAVRNHRLLIHLPCLHQ